MIDDVPRKLPGIEVEVDGKIAWVIGHRPDDQFKETERVLLARRM